MITFNMSVQDQGDDNLLYSSDDEFTPTVLSSFSFSPKEMKNGASQTENLSMTNEIMTKLDFISSQISITQNVLQRMIAKHESTGKLVNQGVRKDDTVTIPSSCGTSYDSPYRKSRVLGENWIKNSESTYSSTENNAKNVWEKINQEQRDYICVDDDVVDTNWFTRVNFAIMQLLKVLFRIFFRAVETQEINIAPVYQSLNPLKVPDDVKIAIELSKAKRVPIKIKTFDR